MRKSRFTESQIVPVRISTTAALADELQYSRPVALMCSAFHSGELTCQP